MDTAWSPFAPFHNFRDGYVCTHCGTSAREAAYTRNPFCSLKRRNPMTLYEYAVIRVDKDGTVHPKPLVPITAVVALDEEHVRKIATRAIPQVATDRPRENALILEEAKILIRPFCQCR